MHFNCSLDTNSEKLPRRRFLLKEFEGPVQNWDAAWLVLNNFILKETHFKIASSSLFIYIFNEDESFFLAREVIGVPTAYDLKNSERIFLKEYGPELIYRFKMSASKIEDFSMANIKEHYYKYKSNLGQNESLKDYWRLEIDEKDLILGDFASNMGLSLDFFADLI